jgi:deoxyxylulose-5-phosphate synthase
MLGPTGLDAFQKQFPERTIDVGIAEQHAVTSAAGMAFAGLHPVVALYSTFLNRAFDQVLLDVALHKAGVTFVLDRSGITGDDGPSHNGMWDLALTGIIPTLHVAAPRDGARLKETLNEAVEISDAPSLVRFPKGAVIEDIPAFERRDGIDVLYRGESADVLLVSVGALAHIAVEAASQAYREGVGVTVIDNYKTNTTIYNDFENLEDAVNSCIASSHIPLVTGGLVNIYRNMLSFDGGFSKFPYLNASKSVLHIHPNLWNHFSNTTGRMKITDYTTLFSKSKFPFRQMVDDGYADSKNNKDFLDSIFIPR